MPVTLNLALRVRRLHQRGLDEAAIARGLGANLADVAEAHRMLDLPLLDRDPEPPPVDAAVEVEREADLERMPKRISDSIRRARGE